MQPPQRADPQNTLNLHPVAAGPATAIRRTVGRGSWIGGLRRRGISHRRPLRAGGALFSGTLGLVQWQSSFGDPREWPDDDLVAWSGELPLELVAPGYAHGLFPMPVEDVIGWFSPVRRGVLPLERLRVTRSLRKTMKHQHTTVDQAFGEVIDRCADPRREHGWIDDQVREVYTELHARGVAHSVETWDEQERLVGGLYGVCLGGLFAGESMFHDPELGRDASKTALVRLVGELGSDGVAGRLLDVQWLTEHLASLGAVEVDRLDYLRQVGAAVQLPEPPAFRR